PWPAACSQLHFVVRCFGSKLPRRGKLMLPVRTQLLLAFTLFSCYALLAQTNTSDKPSWWNKYQYLSSHAASPDSGSSSSRGVGPNVDVSNECGPQSETYVTVNPRRPRNLAGGSN